MREPGLCKQPQVFSFGLSLITLFLQCIVSLVIARNLKKKKNTSGMEFDNTPSSLSGVPGLLKLYLEDKERKSQHQGWLCHLRHSGFALVWHHHDVEFTTPVEGKKPKKILATIIIMFSRKVTSWHLKARFWEGDLVRNNTLSSPASEISGGLLCGPVIDFSNVHFYG